MVPRVEAVLSCKIEISGELPENFPGSRLMEQNICTYSFPSGYLTMQEIDGDGFAIMYHVLHANEPFPYTLDMEYKRLTAIFVLEGYIGIDTGVKETYQLKRNTWKLFHGIKKISISNFPADIVQLVIIHFGDRFIEKINYLFEKLIAMLPALQDINGDNHYLLPETREYLDSILQCNYAPDWKLYFIESRVEDILFNLFLACSGGQSIPHISKTDLEKIAVAERIISGDITKHYIINRLAEEIGMSQTKFKLLFKEVYKLPPHEYLRKLRLKKGVEYLESGYSVKEAAYKTGWRPAVFIEAFKELYHTTPGKYIKNKR